MCFSLIICRYPYRLWFNVRNLKCFGVVINFIEFCRLMQFVLFLFACALRHVSCYNHGRIDSVIRFHYELLGHIKIYWCVNVHGSGLSVVYMEDEVVLILPSHFCSIFNLLFFFSFFTCCQMVISSCLDLFSCKPRKLCS